MKKTDFLNLSKEEILKLASSKNIFNQKLDGDNMLTVLLSKFDSSFLFEVIKYNPEILKEKDADGCPLVERLADKGYFSILESFAKYIDLTKHSASNDKNMLGYLIGKGASNVIYKALEHNPSAINVKDPCSATGTERLADKGYFSILESFAEHIDLTKHSASNDKNMLGYLTSKGASNVIYKALEYNPSVINVKDPCGATGTERLADKGYFSILEKFAKDIDLSKTSYDGSKNMLGYLIGKEANNAVSKALEYNPLVINIKDPAGAPGVERIADKGYFSILEKFAEHIDLTKNSYDGSKNMLGYMMSKGANNAVSKALEYNPSAINVKDPCGATGTERIADKGYFSILEKFAEHIDLTKTSYDGNKNMLGYLIGKEANNAVSKALEYNPSAINVKDPAGATGAERIADKGYFSIIKDNINNIDWSKNTYDGESTLKYILKKSSVSDGIEYIRSAAHNYPETVNKELDFIINKDLVKSLQYKEVSSIINKNRKINGINILTVLSNKGLDKYIEILLGNNSYVEEVKNKETIIEKPKQKTDDSISLDINSVLDDVKKSKSLILDRIKNIKENNELQPEDNNKGNLKSQFKSML